MGYGSYKASDWAKLKSSRGISASSGADALFRNNGLQDKYNPRFIDMRESCDSEDSPNSTPIIIGFDVTGSMGYLAAEIAKNSLDKTITAIYNKQPVTNPHVMCAPFTAPQMDGALQITQFEADIRVIEQLLDLKVGFGGNRYSYDSLVWYFAAEHTKIDCWEKHKKKGFLFCIGDEICGTGADGGLTGAEIEKVFGDKDVSDLTIEKLAKMAGERYEIFHIITGYRMEEAAKTWNEVLPGRVACLDKENIQYLSEVITSLMQLTNGMSRADVLSQWEPRVRSIVENAVKGIKISPAGFLNTGAAENPAQELMDRAKEFLGRMFK